VDKKLKVADPLVGAAEDALAAAIGVKALAG
jgi:hypothetical protein